MSVSSTSPNTAVRNEIHLLRAGFLLILLGLLTGLGVPFLQLPRMALSSHLEGVMNGILLVALALSLRHMSLSSRAQATLFFCAVYGAYANWVATLFSAATGAAATMPIAGQGSVGSPQAEMIVMGLLLSVAATIIAACVIAIAGFSARLRSIRPE